MTIVLSPKDENTNQSSAWVIKIYQHNRWVYLSPEMTYTFDKNSAKVYDDIGTAGFVARIFEGKVERYA